MLGTVKLYVFDSELDKITADHAYERRQKIEAPDLDHRRLGKRQTFEGTGFRLISYCDRDKEQTQKADVNGIIWIEIYYGEKAAVDKA